MEDVQLVQEGDIITSEGFVLGEYASKSVEYVTDAGLKVRDMVADAEKAHYGGVGV